MTWLRDIVREILGLFVEDGSFAIAILLWLAVAWILLPRLRLAAPWRGPVLFGGLGLILIVSAIRYSRGRR